jgi:hypothetical protein
LQKPSNLPVSAAFYFGFFSNFKARAALLRKQREAIPVTVQGNRPKVERVVLNALAEHMPVFSIGPIRAILRERLAPWAIGIGFGEADPPVAQRCTVERVGKLPTSP